jgi:tRNA(Ile)-lysidine synthase
VADAPAQPADAALAALADLLPDDAHLLVALSGGPDSLALLVVAAAWAAEDPARRVLAATVDHGLRPASAAEATACARMSASLGIGHETLVWEGPKPATGVQAAARKARYGLLTEAALRLGATHLATAHHADDQAETVLMRLAAGSGIGGLGGMRAISHLGGIIVVRPFLGLRKAALASICADRSLTPLDDPSNGAQRFSRGRLRKVMPHLEAEGLTVERLTRLARRAAAADEALEIIAAQRLNEIMDRLSADVLGLRWGLLLTAPEELQVRVLRQAMASRESETAQPARLEALEQLVGDIGVAARDGQGLRRTLAGRMLTFTPDGTLVIGKAPPRRTC